MTNKALQDPESIAKHLIKDLAIDTKQATNLEYALTELNIRIVKRKIKNGILGACKAVGLKRLIIIDPDINHEGRERFTIAHEMGHIMMRHGSTVCNNNDLFPGENAKAAIHQIEKDANAFASEFLMPASEVIKSLKLQNLNLELAEMLASRYNVSLTSAAIKIVNNSSVPAILLFFEFGKFKWATFSKDKGFLQISKLPTSDLLSEVGEYKQYDPALFFTNIDENTDCWAQMKHYNPGNYSFDLCMVTLDDEADF